MRLPVKKTSSWEFFPSKNPVLESAFILIDTSYFNNLGLKTRVVHYNSNTNKTWIEIIQHSKNEISIQTIGTFKNTIEKNEILPFQKTAIKNNSDFTFYDYDDSNIKLKSIKLSKKS
jgi:hypothetical protein